MSKEIKLTQGKVAIVDDEDYGWLNQWKWSTRTTKRNVYAERRDYRMGRRNAKSISMHRLITNAPPELQVDHKDGDGLNNQKSNLRLCTQKQNSANQRRHKNNSTGFIGVTTHRGENVWRAQIGIDGKRTYIGRFKTPEEAARAYDKRARETFGEFANLNFKGE